MQAWWDDFRGNGIVELTRYLADISSLHCNSSVSSDFTWVDIRVKNSDNWREKSDYVNCTSDRLTLGEDLTYFYFDWLYIRSTNY